MHIAVTGATGFVGTQLVSALCQGGHTVTAFVRDATRAASVLPDEAKLHEYDPLDVDSVAAGLDGVEAVVNLAGMPIFAKRWSPAVLQALRDSRVETTNTLVEAMGKDWPPPRALISASAIGYYGPRDPDDLCREDELDATTLTPRDDLANICWAWERAADKATLLGMRVVRLRIGMVLGRGGGALQKMERPFKLGIGGRVGSGKQVMSWIHVDDLVAMIRWALEDEDVAGALNGVAPNPVDNRTFTKALGKALGRPTVLPMPGIGLRLLFGKVASVLMTGQRVSSDKAEALGFAFQYPTVEQALSAIYG